jgi:CubicO group peptidase (beta-lactamase class C family)
MLPPAGLAARVDRLFEKWNRNDTPGCAVGVAIGGRLVVRRAYGMANLECGARLTVDTVFEAGSVSWPAGRPAARSMPPRRSSTWSTARRA